MFSSTYLVLYHFSLFQFSISSYISSFSSTYFSLIFILGISPSNTVLNPLDSPTKNHHEKSHQITIETRAVRVAAQATAGAALQDGLVEVEAKPGNFIGISLGFGKQLESYFYWKYQ